VRVGTRGGIEVGAVLSCGVLVEGRRTEQELSCGEPFEDMHPCARRPRRLRSSLIIGKLPVARREGRSYP
jgi:hypothetical protein